MSYNKDATRGLERLIDNTSTTSAPDSIVQAYEMVRGGNARGKRDHTPSNDVFLHKKGLGHRASWNDLIKLVDTPEKEIVSMHLMWLKWVN